MAEEKEKDFFDKLGGVLSRAGEGAVDSLADSRSIVGSVIGGALQAGLETEGYQDKQESRDYERWKRDAQRKIMGNQLEEAELDKPVIASKRAAEIQKNKEFMADADFREAQRTAGLQEANEYIASAPVREAKNIAAKTEAEEYVAAAPFRQSQQKMAQQYSDNQFKASEIDAISANFRKAMSSDPNHPFNQCTVQEQDAICSSSKLQAMFESQYYTRELIRTIGKDEVAWGRVSRAVENAGGEVIADKPGAFSLNIYGRKIPLNEQSIMGLNEQVKKAAMEELQSRATFSVNLTAGNPAGRAVAKRVNALMPYMQNDCVATSGYIQKFVDDMPQEQKIYMLFNQTFDDFFDPTVSQETKNREIQAVIPFLSQLGFQLDMPDKDPTHARFLDQQNQRAYTLDEFRNFVKENDLGGQMLDQQIAGAKAACEKAEALKMLKSVNAPDGLLNDNANDPLSEDDQYYMDLSQEVYKLAPNLKKTLDYKVKTFNQENPKRPISADDANMMVGEAHEAAIRDANGDPETYKHALLRNMNSVFEAYDIEVPEEDIGFDDKMHDFKIGENQSSIQKNEDKVAEHDAKISELRKTHEAEFAALEKKRKAVLKQNGTALNHPDVQLERQKLGGMALFGTNTSRQSSAQNQVAAVDKEIKDLEEKLGITELESAIQKLKSKNDRAASDTTRRQRIKDDQQTQREQQEQQRAEAQKKRRNLEVLLKGE